MSNENSFYSINKSMKSQQLIEMLSQFDPDTPVVRQGYEAGYNSISIIEQKSIQMNVNPEHFYGAHGPTDHQPEPVPNVPFVDVIYLGGYNHISREHGLY
ncbi:hypothetical protein [Laspinema olomoucense]|nr:hypothetical protein [Laspinema sp. D3b]